MFLDMSKNLEITWHNSCTCTYNLSFHDVSNDMHTCYLYVVPNLRAAGAIAIPAGIHVQSHKAILV